MKFKKEIKLVIEGEISDDSIDPIEIFKNLKIKWQHWWEYDKNWVYGMPSLSIQKGVVNKIYLDQNEIENTKNIQIPIEIKK